MPKYSQIKAKDLIKLLLKNGFTEHSKVGSHFTYKNEITKKRLTIPVHNKPLGKGLLNAILKQAGFNKDILEKENN